MKILLKALPNFMIAIGLLGSTWIFCNTYIKTRPLTHTIDVKGYAEKAIVSEVGTWKFLVVAREPDLKKCFSKLSHGKAKVLALLKSLNIKDQELEIQPINKREILEKNEKGHDTNKIEAYHVSQAFVIESKDTLKISKLPASVESLNQEGVEIESSQPSYFYPSDKMDALKVDLLGEATQNARKRALQLAKNSDAKVGRLLSTRQGVFQVTAPYSSDLSDYGTYDTSSIKKVVKIVVTASYSTEGSS